MVLITFNWLLFVFKYTNTLEKGSIFLVGRIPLPDVHKIRIICLLFNKFLRNFTNLSGNKFPTQYIQIKLILGSNFYDKMQLYGILGQPSYMDEVKRFINHSRFQNNFQLSSLRFLLFEGNMFSGYF